jgi:hypothetical protein
MFALSLVLLQTPTQIGYTSTTGLRSIPLSLSFLNLPMHKIPVPTDAPGLIVPTSPGTETKFLPNPGTFINVAKAISREGSDRLEEYLSWAAKFLQTAYQDSGVRQRTRYPGSPPQ